MTEIQAIGCKHNNASPCEFQPPLNGYGLIIPLPLHIQGNLVYHIYTIQIYISQYQVLRTSLYTSLTPRHHLNFSRKHSAKLQLYARRLAVHTSTAVYRQVLVYAAQGGICLGSHTASPAIRTRVLSVDSPKLYPLSYGVRKEGISLLLFFSLYAHV